MKILGSPFDIRAKQYVISYENSGAGNQKIVRSSSLATQVEHPCARFNKCVVQDERWVCGIAITKFFHANATIKYRKNLISHLISDDSIPATSHKDKE